MTAKRWRPIYIGIGSNLDGPLRQVSRAAAALRGLDGCIAWRFSRAYGSEPLGPADQPDYVNAVGAAMSHLDPQTLLEALQIIETEAGRVRDGTRWGPRCLDLDLLAVGQLTVNDETLTLPHPEIGNRQFVIEPLFECAPYARIPALSSLRALRGGFDGALTVVGELT
ncbi:MAG: 2-amino-4-hydroxy-6-hydroxymethyldihydropteridine diphosphokinase [Pseudomonadota bacterium]